MYQIDVASAAATLPTPNPAGTPGYFTDGNLLTGVEPTIVPADFMNMLMMEIVNVITASGLTLSKTSYNQLLQALNTTFASKLQIQNNSLIYSNGGGAANAYTASYTPAVTTLVDGMILSFRAVANNTGAATFSPDGLTARPILGGAHSPLQGGELVTNGKVELMYHAGLTSWVLLGCTGGAAQVGSATQSQHAATYSQAQTLANNALTQAQTLINTATTQLQTQITSTAVPASQQYFIGQF